MIQPSAIGGKTACSHEAPIQHDPFKRLRGKCRCLTCVEDITADTHPKETIIRSSSVESSSTHTSGQSAKSLPNLKVTEIQLGVSIHKVGDTECNDSSSEPQLSRIFNKTPAGPDIHGNVQSYSLIDKGESDKYPAIRELLKRPYKQRVESEHWPYKQNNCENYQEPHPIETKEEQLEGEDSVNMRAKPGATLPPKTTYWQGSSPIPYSANPQVAQYYVHQNVSGSYCIEYGSSQQSKTLVEKRGSQGQSLNYYGENNTAPRYANPVNNGGYVPAPTFNPSYHQVAPMAPPPYRGQHVPRGFNTRMHYPPTVRFMPPQPVRFPYYNVGQELPLDLSKPKAKQSNGVVDHPEDNSQGAVSPKGDVYQYGDPPLQTYSQTQNGANLNPSLVQERDSQSQITNGSITQPNVVPLNISSSNIPVSQTANRLVTNQAVPSSTPAEVPTQQVSGSIPYLNNKKMVRQLEEQIRQEAFLETMQQPVPPGQVPIFVPPERAVLPAQLISIPVTHSATLPPPAPRFPPAHYTRTTLPPPPQPPRQAIPESTTTHSNGLISNPNSMPVSNGATQQPTNVVSGPVADIFKSANIPPGQYVMFPVSSLPQRPTLLPNTHNERMRKPSILPKNAPAGVRPQLATRIQMPAPSSSCGQVPVTYPNYSPQYQLPVSGPIPSTVVPHSVKYPVPKETEQNQTSSEDELPTLVHPDGFVPPRRVPENHKQVTASVILPPTPPMDDHERHLVATSSVATRTFSVTTNTTCTNVIDVDKGTSDRAGLGPGVRDQTVLNQHKSNHPDKSVECLQERQENVATVGNSPIDSSQSTISRAVNEQISKSGLPQPGPIIARCTDTALRQLLDAKSRDYIHAQSKAIASARENPDASSIPPFDFGNDVIDTSSAKTELKKRRKPPASKKNYLTAKTVDKLKLRIKLKTPKRSKSSEKRKRRPKSNKQPSATSVSESLYCQETATIGYNEDASSQKVLQDLDEEFESSRKGSVNGNDPFSPVSDRSLFETQDTISYSDPNEFPENDCQLARLEGIVEEDEILSPERGNLPKSTQNANADNVAVKTFSVTVPYPHHSPQYQAHTSGPIPSTVVPHSVTSQPPKATQQNKALMFENVTSDRLSEKVSEVNQIISDEEDVEIIKIEPGPTCGPEDNAVRLQSNSHLVHEPMIVSDSSKTTLVPESSNSESECEHHTTETESSEMSSAGELEKDMPKIVWFGSLSNQAFNSNHEVIRELCKDNENMDLDAGATCFVSNGVVLNRKTFPPGTEEQETALNSREVVDDPIFEDTLVSSDNEMPVLEKFEVQDLHMAVREVKKYDDGDENIRYSISHPNDGDERNFSEKVDISDSKNEYCFDPLSDGNKCDNVQSESIKHEQRASVCDDKNSKKDAFPNIDSDEVMDNSLRHDIESIISKIGDSASCISDDTNSQKIKSNFQLLKSKYQCKVLKPADDSKNEDALGTTDVKNVDRNIWDLIKYDDKPNDFKSTIDTTLEGPASNQSVVFESNTDSKNRPTALVKPCVKTNSKCEVSAPAYVLNSVSSMTSNQTELHEVTIFTDEMTVPKTIDQSADISREVGVQSKPKPRIYKGYHFMSVRLHHLTNFSNPSTPVAKNKCSNTPPLPSVKTKRQRGRPKKKVKIGINGSPPSKFSLTCAEHVKLLKRGCKTDTLLRLTDKIKKSRRSWLLHKKRDKKKTLVLHKFSMRTRKRRVSKRILLSAEKTVARTRESVKDVRPVKEPPTVKQTKLSSKKPRLETLETIATAKTDVATNSVKECSDIRNEKVVNTKADRTVVARVVTDYEQCNEIRNLPNVISDNLQNSEKTADSDGKQGTSKTKETVRKLSKKFNFLSSWKSKALIETVKVKRGRPSKLKPGKKLARNPFDKHALKRFTKDVIKKKQNVVISCDGGVSCRDQKLKPGRKPTRTKSVFDRPSKRITKFVSEKQEKLKSSETTEEKLSPIVANHQQSNQRNKNADTDTNSGCSAQKKPTLRSGRKSKQKRGNKSKRENPLFERALKKFSKDVFEKRKQNLKLSEVDTESVPSVDANCTKSDEQCTHVNTKPNSNCCVQKRPKLKPGRKPSKGSGGHEIAALKYTASERAGKNVVDKQEGKSKKNCVNENIVKMVAKTCIQNPKKKSNDGKVSNNIFENMSSLNMASVEAIAASSVTSSKDVASGADCKNDLGKGVRVTGDKKNNDSSISMGSKKGSVSPLKLMCDKPKHNKEPLEMSGTLIDGKKNERTRKRKQSDQAVDVLGNSKKGKTDRNNLESSKDCSNTAKSGAQNVTSDKTSESKNVSETDKKLTNVGQKVLSFFKTDANIKTGGDSSTNLMDGTQSPLDGKKKNGDYKKIKTSLKFKNAKIVKESPSKLVATKRKLSVTDQTQSVSVKFKREGMDGNKLDSVEGGIEKTSLRKLKVKSDKTIESKDFSAAETNLTNIYRKSRDPRLKFEPKVKNEDGFMITSTVAAKSTPFERKLNGLTKFKSAKIDKDNLDRKPTSQSVTATPEKTDSVNGRDTEQHPKPFSALNGSDVSLAGNYCVVQRDGQPARSVKVIDYVESRDGKIVQKFIMKSLFPESSTPIAFVKFNQKDYTMTSSLILSLRGDARDVRNVINNYVIKSGARQMDLSDRHSSLFRAVYGETDKKLINASDVLKMFNYSQLQDLIHWEQWKRVTKIKDPYITRDKTAHYVNLRHIHEELFSDFPLGSLERVLRMYSFVPHIATKREQNFFVKNGGTRAASDATVCKIVCVSGLADKLNMIRKYLSCKD